MISIALVSLLLFGSSRVVSAAVDGQRLFGYPDDDHVIITHYGPVRYRPVTADEMNRPYDDGGGGGRRRIPTGRGYYRAEVIPLDMNTWKPVPGAVGSWTANGPVGERSPTGNGRFDGRSQTGNGLVGGTSPTGSGAESVVFDVPLTVGYSVRPTKPVRPRRRRQDHRLITGYQLPPPPPKLIRSRYPGPRSPSDAAIGLWTV